MYLQAMIYRFGIFIMTKTEKRMLKNYIIFLLAFLLITSLLGCDSGWSIMGWEIK